MGERISLHFKRIRHRARNVAKETKSASAFESWSTEMTNRGPGWTDLPRPVEMSEKMLNRNFLILLQDQNMWTRVAGLDLRRLHAELTSGNSLNNI